MADNILKEQWRPCFHGMDGVVSSKTVVGEAIHINGYDHSSSWWTFLLR